MTIQPQRSNASDMIGGFMKALQNITAHFTLLLRPQGNYSGSKNPVVSNNDSIVTNPWGTTAMLVDDPFAWNPQPGLNMTLAPGQSVNLSTGQLSDPNISQNTANNLNSALKQRASNESGLAKASTTSSRGQGGFLSQLDDLYLGNQASPATHGQQLTNVNLANESDLTILGPKPSTTKTPIKPPAARALS